MSKEHAEKKFAVARAEGSPVLSEESYAKIAALQAVPGQINHVSIAHEWFCANAMRRGAKKCMCDPGIRLLDRNDPKDAAIIKRMES